MASVDTVSRRDHTHTQLIAQNMYTLYLEMHLHFCPIADHDTKRQLHELRSLIFSPKTMHPSPCGETLKLLST